MRSTDTIPGTNFRVRQKGLHEFIDQATTQARSYTRDLNGALTSHDCELWRKLWSCRTVTGRFLVTANLEVERTFISRSKGRTLTLGLAVPDTELSHKLALLCSATALASGLFGSFHALAWNFVFGTHAERVLWRFSSICIALFPAVALPLVLLVIPSRPSEEIKRLFQEERLYWSLGTVVILCLGAYSLGNLLARTYLVFESFYALPDSPPSVYVVPHWAAYLPHIS